MNIDLHEFLKRSPIVPFIREADYAIRNPWSMHERRLFDYLLVYIQEGKCIFTVNGKDYFLREGDFYLVQPNSLVSLQGTTKTITPFVHMDIFYHSDRLVEVTEEKNVGQMDTSLRKRIMQPRLNDFEDVAIPIQFKPENPLWFRDSLIKVIKLWQAGDTLGLIEAQIIASELIFSMLKQYGEFITKSTKAPEDFNWITSYLTFYLSEDISVEDMAKRMRMSISNFSTLFRKHFGISPHQYLVKLRIQHAEELLLHSNLKLDEIAENCGFTNAQHFSKMFKKHTGRTPGSLRKDK